MKMFHACCSSPSTGTRNAPSLNASTKSTKGPLLCIRHPEQKRMNFMSTGGKLVHKAFYIYLYIYKYLKPKPKRTIELSSLFFHLDSFIICWLEMLHLPVIQPLMHSSTRTHKHTGQSFYAVFVCFSTIASSRLVFQ